MATNNEALLYKIKGTITSYKYGTSDYDPQDAKPMHRVGIAFADGEREKLVDFCTKNNIYANTSFIPSWYKPRADHANDDKFINLKSNFDFPVFYRDENAPDGIAKSTIGDISSDLGSIVGSEVCVSLAIKEGAVYPSAIAITKLKVQTFESFFGEEDLPFN